MSDIVAKDQNSSDIQLSSKSETMQMVFNDLRTNGPKPLENCVFHRMRVHKRSMSLPNMNSRGNSEASTEVRWKSMPNLMLPAFDDSESNMMKPFECSDVHSLLVQLKSGSSLPNTAIRENSSGDAPEIGFSFVASEELPVSTDSPLCAESCVATLLPPATDDCCIETPLSVSSPLPPAEDGVTDKVTSSGGSDAGTDLVVTTGTPRRPARSLWNRTKRFVRRMFCCGAIDRADE